MSLERQHRKLQGGREEDDVSKMVRVTGPNGVPTYAQRDAQFAKGYIVGGESDPEFKTELELHAVTHATCRLSDIQSCELHVGADQVYRLGDCADCDIIPRKNSCTAAFNCRFLHDPCTGFHDISLYAELGLVPGANKKEVASGVLIGIALNEYRDEDVATVKFTKFIRFASTPLG